MTTKRKARKPRVWKRWALVWDDGSLHWALYQTRENTVVGEAIRVEIREVLPKRRARR